jgi:dCTP deaminase
MDGNHLQPLPYCIPRLEHFQIIINGKKLLAFAPIIGMLSTKERAHGVSHGLAEAGYDIRLKQDIVFDTGLNAFGMPYYQTIIDNVAFPGRFTLASAIEEFDMPDFLVGKVADKSTWARQGVSVFNTVIEPGWKGFLTLEIVFQGEKVVRIPAGAGIAQVIFHQVCEPRSYKGKYQNQKNMPVAARSST